MHAYFANENENFLTFFFSSKAVTKKLILTFDFVTSVRTLSRLSNNFPVPERKKFRLDIQMVRATPFAWETLRRYGFSFDDMRIFYIFFFWPDDLDPLFTGSFSKKVKRLCTRFPWTGHPRYAMDDVTGFNFGLSIGLQKGTVNPFLLSETG